MHGSSGTQCPRRKDGREGTIGWYRVNLLWRSHRLYQENRPRQQGLGRWCWILFSREHGHKARVITAYNPCRNKNANSETTYQQQRRYFITKWKDLTCPLILFRRQLTKQIKEWQAEGDRIILFMDYNEHVTNGPLGKLLADKEGLELREAILHHTRSSPGATFFRGSKPIDGL